MITMDEAPLVHRMGIAFLYPSERDRMLCQDIWLGNKTLLGYD